MKKVSRIFSEMHSSCSWESVRSKTIPLLREVKTNERSKERCSEAGRTVDNAEDILVRYRAEEMCLLIDEIGKITEFSYPLMLKTLDRVVVNTNGKLTFIFQSGIKITV